MTTYLCKRCLQRITNLSFGFGVQKCHVSGTQSNLPVIRIPKSLEKKAQDVESRRRGPVKWKGRIFTARPGAELISSKRKEFNHYVNQSYDKFAPPKLASQGWKHSKARGDHFTILAYKGNPSVISKKNSEGDVKELKTFHDLKVSKPLLDGIEMMDITSPTTIQTSAIPAVLQGKNTLCAAETGSGKTLTYLLPLMERLLQESKLSVVSVQERCPRGVILVPVGELAAQVLEVAKVLGESAGLSVECLDGETSLKSMEKRFSSPIDVVVSTPGPLLNAVRQGFASLEAVTHLVVDESDTMLDDSFVQQTLSILKLVTIGPGKPCKVTPPGEAQLTLVGATMPRKATSILAEIIPAQNLEIISTPHLHRIMPHVLQKFFRLHSEDKAVKIVELLKKEQKRDVPTMVFCNTVSSCDWLAYHLTEHGFNALRLHSKMGGKSRNGVLSAFRAGEANVLVCTDIASRGVDTVQVQHVINFDFPQYMSDYIHRTGRVGRVGSQGNGHVTSFVVHKWDVDLVSKIERAVRMRQDLPRVDANIKGKHHARLVDEDLQDLKTLQG